MKKSFVVAAFALLSVVTFAGCSASSGITHIGGGKVAVARNSALGNAAPILYDCSSGTSCVIIGK